MEIKKLPENMSQMTCLTSLIVTSNKKLTEIPESIFSVTNLEVLNLSDNNLKIIPEGINKLENLKYLYLASNSLKSLPNLI